MKTALITGITGQDGSYLAEFLIKKGYRVFGLIRRTSTDPLMRIGELYADKKITLLNGNMRDSGSLKRVLEKSKPDEIYNLAAQSDVGISFDCAEETFEINYHGLGRLVHEVLEFNPKIKIYQASTSEMYGKTKPPQNEKSPFQPVSPYGEAKLRAHEDYVVGYRNKHNLFICSGILFNHESPRRGKHFVTRKITVSLGKIKAGEQDYFTLGNLDSKRDWGYAKDYVEGMWMMLQAKKPDDYVLATNETHTVREFVVEAGKVLGMDIVWKGKGLKEIGVDKKTGKTVLKIDPFYFRPREVDFLKGDYSKARKKLGWKPKTKFRELVKIMTLADSENKK